VHDVEETKSVGLNWGCGYGSEPMELVAETTLREIGAEGEATGHDSDEEMALSVEESSRTAVTSLI